MSEVKHTPGPWFVSSSGSTVYALHGNPLRNRFSALVQSGRRDDAGDEENNANARLMAAAPDLLEALEMAVDQMVASAKDHAARLGYEYVEERSDAIVAARAAIAKATSPLTP